MNGVRIRHLIAAAVLGLLSFGSLGCGCLAMGRKTPAAGPSAAPVIPPADLEKEVLAQDARRIEAMVHADAKVLGEILRDDLTYIHSSGPLEGKAQVIDEIVSGKLRYQAIEPSEQTVRIVGTGGDTAVVTGRALLKVESARRPLEVPVHFTEVWVRAQGVWRLAAWQSTRIP